MKKKITKVSSDSSPEVHKTVIHETITSDSSPIQHKLNNLSSTESATEIIKSVPLPSSKKSSNSSSSNIKKTVVLPAPPADMTPTEQAIYYKGGSFTTNILKLYQEFHYAYVNIHQ